MMTWQVLSEGATCCCLLLLLVLVLLLWLLLLHQGRLVRLVPGSYVLNIMSFNFGASDVLMLLFLLGFIGAPSVRGRRTSSSVSADPVHLNLIFFWASRWVNLRGFRDSLSLIPVSAQSKC